MYFIDTWRRTLNTTAQKMTYRTSSLPLLYSVVGTPFSKPFTGYESSTNGRTKSTTDSRVRDILLLRIGKWGKMGSRDARKCPDSPALSWVDRSLAAETEDRRLIQILALQSFDESSSTWSKVAQCPKWN